MITPSLRLKVTDFLATDFENDVFQELMRIKQLPYLKGINFPLYLWYDRETEVVDLNTLEQFIVYWKASGEHGTKISIHPEPFDDQNHFIWYDIRPNSLQEKLKPKLNIPYMQYYRFAYTYSNPKTGILEGLKDFQEKYKFVNRDELPGEFKRKQKRNDDEDSNHRK